MAEISRADDPVPPGFNNQQDATVQLFVAVMTMALLLEAFKGKHVEEIKSPATEACFSCIKGGHSADHTSNTH